MRRQISGGVVVFYPVNEIFRNYNARLTVVASPDTARRPCSVKIPLTCGYSRINIRYYICIRHTVIICVCRKIYYLIRIFAHSRSIRC